MYFDSENVSHVRTIIFTYPVCVCMHVCSFCMYCDQLNVLEISLYVLLQCIQVVVLRSYDYYIQENTKVLEYHVYT